MSTAQQNRDRLWGFCGVFVGFHVPPFFLSTDYEARDSTLESRTVTANSNTALSMAALSTISMWAPRNHGYVGQNAQCAACSSRCLCSFTLTIKYIACSSSVKSRRGG